MKTKFGLFIKCPHPEIIECLGIQNANFAVIDMEHTPVSQSTLYPLVLAAELHNLELIVRIPDNKEMFFKWCLDLGIKKIQIPHVQTASDVKMAIKFAKFAPEGERGLCRFVRSAEFSNKDRNMYIQKSNEQTTLIFQIEGETGVNNIDEILDEVPEHSSIFIGPYDLSQSLGIPGQIWDKKVINKMQNIISKCKKRNISIGTFTDTTDGIKHWIDLEVDFIEYSSDLNIFMEGYKSIYSVVNNSLKNKLLKFGDNYQ